MFDTRVTNRRVHFVLNDAHAADPLFHGPGIPSLLGLGHKFIPTPRPLSAGDVTADVLRFALHVLSAYRRATRDENEFRHFQLDDFRDFRPQRLPQSVAELRAAVSQQLQRAAGVERIQLQRLAAWFRSLETDAVTTVSALATLKRKPNTSRLQRDTLAALRKRNDIGVNNADKNLGITVYSRDRFDTAVDAHVLDTDVYTPVHDTAENVITRIQAASAAVFSRFPSLLRFKFRLHGKRLASFYITWKLHKAPPVGRPIASCIGTVTANASRFLDAQLQPLYSDHPNILRDSDQLLRLLDDIVVSDHAILAAADVTALYPSIDLGRGIAALTDFLHLFSGWDDKRIADIAALADFVLRNNYIVTRDGRIFLQIRGTAMGTPFAVAFAVIFMIMLEQPVINRFRASIGVYKRFIDDVFLLWTGTANQLDSFRLALASVDPNIGFTWTTSSTTVDFMDCTVFRVGHRLGYRLYAKALNNYLYLAASSFHPPHTRPAFIRAELLRGLSKSSVPGDFLHWKRLLYFRLRERGYHIDLLNDAFEAVRWEDRDAILRRPARATLDSDQRPPLVFATSYTPSSLALRRVLSITTDDIPGLQDFPDIAQQFAHRRVIFAFRRGRTLASLLQR